ncbi:MAG: PilZ domain-containing protein [Alphaproteobacteria bacterium]|nr:PilZ domain-containing protein [Alphaproteobacteria bacterium]
MQSPEPECPTLSPEDARREARKHVLLGGKVVYRGGAASLDCTILDLSASGARIRIGRGQAIPSRFHLIDIRNRTAYDAAVVWLNPPLAGLRFDVGYPLGSSLPTALGYLRTLWIECALR